MSDTEGDPIEEALEADPQLEPTVEEAKTQEQENSSEGDPKDVLDKRYKDLQRYTTKLEQENKEFRDKLSEVSGKVDAVMQMAPREPREPQKSWLEAEQWDSKIREDPAVAIEMVKKLRNEVAELLMERDRFYEGRLESLDPRVTAVREKIEALRKDPDYQYFSDAQLAIIAKKMKPVDNSEEEDEVIRVARGGFGGGSRPKKDAKKAEDPAVSFWMKKMGYDKIKD